MLRVSLRYIYRYGLSICLKSPIGCTQRPKAHSYPLRRPTGVRTRMCYMVLHRWCFTIMLCVLSRSLQLELAGAQKVAKDVLEQIDRIADEVMQDNVDLKRMRELAYDREDAVTHLHRCGAPPPPPPPPSHPQASPYHFCVGLIMPASYVHPIACLTACIGSVMLSLAT